MSKKCIELIKELKTFCMRDGQNECIAWLEKKGEQKPRMIQWKGNNLNEVIAFTGKDKNFDKWFKSFEEYEKCVHEDNDIFKLFNEDGSHYEVPVGAWIVKTPDGYNVASKAVLKQKLADKVEPKFKVGDWVVYECGEDTATLQIAGIVGETYVFSDDSTLDVVDEDTLRLWDITKDAKDGDVLYLQKDGKEHIIIYKGVIKERFRTFVSAYCAYNGIVDAFCFADVSRYVDIAYRGIIPATKEQRDLLFQKMKEAGYEWDAEKKELKKIEQKTAENIDNLHNYLYGGQKPADKVEPKFKVGDWIRYKTNPDDVERVDCVSDNHYILDIKGKCNTVLFTCQDLWELVEYKPAWSKEDDNCICKIINWLDVCKAYNQDSKSIKEISEHIQWLKSLRPQNRWKPSDEQMETLEYYMHKLIATKHKEVLFGLYSDLKQLKQL